MLVKRTLLSIVTAVAIVWVGSEVGRAQSGAIITPKSIPTSATFPVSPTVINGWIASNNMTAMRAHAWDLWLAMSTDSGEVYNGESLPVWETWYGTNDLFPAPQSSNVDLLVVARSVSRDLRAFVSPRQFHHDTKKAAPLVAPEQVVSFNKFDPEAAAFIVAPQAGPNGQHFSYNTQAGLQALNAAWSPSTPTDTRGVNEFPTKAMELKPVFSLVKATGLSAQPLWQGPTASSNPANPTPNTWAKCVLVDPVGTGVLRSATTAEISSGDKSLAPNCKEFLYAPLSLLYSFKLSADDARAFASAQGGNAKAGDYAVLVAMHVNTKEIPFWTWQTFWWQPGDDTPNGFPGSRVGQPANIKTPWNNYATCVNYNQTTSGNVMDVCFNPYLETSPGIPVGITSNCMSCHGVARVLANSSDESYPPDYKAPIAFYTDQRYYNSGSTRTDFSWALPAAQ